jgi:hypothetical protein
MTIQERKIEHLKAWQESGLTQAVYCQQHGLNPKVSVQPYQSSRVDLT